MKMKFYYNALPMAVVADLNDHKMSPRHSMNVVADHLDVYTDHTVETLDVQVGSVVQVVHEDPP
mgnify:CR=1 FL=1